MTGNDDWISWAEAWRADEANSTDIDAIEQRVRSARRGRSVRTGIDLAAAGSAIVVSVWVMITGGTAGMIVGLAGLAFALFGLVVALGRERTPAAMASRTVAAALGWEIATARSAVRGSVGGMAVAAACLVFLAICAAVFRHEGLLTFGGAAFYVMLAALAYVLGAAALSAWLYRRRRARVRRLETLLADLTDEAD